MRNSVALRLHVPEPKSRPGDQPNFAGMEVPPAGIVDRPDVAVPARDIRDLAYSLIRVLDDEGHAVGAWNPNLDPETMRRGLRAMLLTRIYDDR
ncbi:MAG: 3-methyl-2-oxobutanoate dehydrogenase (2-methylpropanoyl-transferring) subunit alpha, partial [Acetobacteraceae bacterium]|nr:3-methyl-2-oxobutanoate dehydrogenase (2-methylpropanoyl-transferring) subunit alpha [Acetobacteraceae bacterium]